MSKVKVKKKARDALFGGLTKKTAFAAMKADEDMLEELEGCFGSLATAAVTANDSIESLVKSNALLTKTNAELSAVVKSQAAKIKSSVPPDFRWGAFTSNRQWSASTDCIAVWCF